MSKYDGLTKAELLAAIEEKGASELIASIAKYPAKPTNEELVAVLEAFDVGQTDTSVTNDVIATAAAPIKLPEPEAIDAEEQVMLNTELMIPVIVTDYDQSMTTEENIENRVFRGSTGNLMTGTISFAVAMHGKMQYLPKIVIDHLRTVTMTSNFKDASGKEVSVNNRPRFNVAEVEGWTEDELEAHKKEQSLKKVSANS